MIAITVKKNFDLGKVVRAIPRETARLINDIADTSVMDIREGAEKGVDIDGGKFKKLTKSTIASKRKAGYRMPEKPLIGSNKMIGVGAKGGRRGIYVKIRATTRSLLAVVTTAAATPYAVYHQEGTPPYEIRPKTAKVLAFTGSQGETVFAKKVKHPGLEKRKWFGISKRMPRKIDRLIKAAERRIVNAGDIGAMK